MAKQWYDRDAEGNLYYFDLEYEGPNLPAYNDFYLNVTWNVTDGNVRFRQVELIFRSDRIEIKREQLTHPQYSIGRHWGANQQREKLRVYYDRFEDRNRRVEYTRASTGAGSSVGSLVADDSAAGATVNGAA